MYCRGTVSLWWSMMRVRTNQCVVCSSCRRSWAGCSRLCRGCTRSEVSGSSSSRRWRGGCRRRSRPSRLRGNRSELIYTHSDYVRKWGSDSAAPLHLFRISCICCMNSDWLEMRSDDTVRLAAAAVFSMKFLSIQGQKKYMLNMVWQQATPKTEIWTKKSQQSKLLSLL